MRKGFLLLPCLLLGDAGPALAQYYYPPAYAGNGYAYTPQVMAPAYSRPAYPSPYYYYGGYAYPAYPGAAAQRPAGTSGPGQPYFYNPRSAQPPAAAPQTAAAGSEAATSPGSSQAPRPLPSGQEAPPQSGQHRVYHGYPFLGLPGEPPPASVGTAPSAVLDGAPPITGDLLVEEGGGCCPAPTVPIPAKGPARPCCFWVTGEYLLWRIRNSPFPPLVTTGNPTQGESAGVLGVPGTITLFGGNNVDYGQMSGGRITIGTWINHAGTIGLEGSGFLLSQGNVNYSIASTGAGQPAIYIPAINALTGTESRLIVSDPAALFSGSVNIHTSSQLGGAEFNGLFNMICCPHFRLDGLTGIRYLSLNEHFDLSNTTQDLVFLTTTTLNDHFNTINQFYGGQMGLRASVWKNRWFADVTGKVALGRTYETLDITGNGVQSGPAAAAPIGTFNGGFFAQPSNIGQHHQNTWAAASQVTGRIGWQVVPHFYVFAGYDFLFWNNVARVGNQIDRSLNLTQSPVFGTGTLVGTPRPLANITSSSFFANGVSLGMEVRY